MSREASSQLRKARILGAGAVVTLEDADGNARCRVRVTERCGRRVRIEALPGSGVAPSWAPGQAHVLRVARPFGLFLYHAVVQGQDDGGSCLLQLAPGPARRRQHRSYFRMPVRLGVRLEGDDHPDDIVVLRACNLSGNGILVFDPEQYLDKGMSVRLAMPIGYAGEVYRLAARAVRVQVEEPRRVALTFEGIGEGTRQVLLRYLVRQHRLRRSGFRAASEPPRVFSIDRGSEIAG